MPGGRRDSMDRRQNHGKGFVGATCQAVSTYHLIRSWPMGGESASLPHALCVAWHIICRPRRGTILDDVNLKNYIKLCSCYSIHHVDSDITNPAAAQHTERERERETPELSSRFEKLPSCPLCNRARSEQLSMVYRYKSKEDLEAVFSSSGVSYDKPIVTSCGTGVTASVLALGLFIINPDQAVRFHANERSHLSHKKPACVWLGSMSCKV